MDMMARVSLFLGWVGVVDHDFGWSHRPNRFPIRSIPAVLRAIQILQISIPRTIFPILRRTTFAGGSNG